MPNLMRLFQNLLSIVQTVAGNTGSEAYQIALRKYRAAIRTLKLSLLAPIVLYLIGMVVGGSGDVHTAKLIFAIGGFLGVALFIAFWSKGFVYSYLVMLATNAVQAANPLSEELPLIAREKIDKMLTWLRSYNAWYAAVNIMFALLPMWNSWYWTIMIITCVIGLSSVMSAWATYSVWPRRFATWGMVGTVLVAVFSITFPELADAMTSFGDSRTAELTGEIARRSAMNDAVRDGEADRLDRDAKLIKAFRARQKALEDRAADGCEDYEDADKSAGAPYCSAADKRAHSSLAEKIGRLEAGTYWDSATARRSPTSSKRPAETTPYPTKGTASSTAKLPPPPSLPGGAPPARSGSKRSHDSGGGGSGPVPNAGGIDWDYVLAPLPSRRQ